MEKVYAVFEGQRILKMSRSKQECIDYRNSFPEEIKRKMFLAEKIIRGAKEHEQSHWMFG